MIRSSYVTSLQMSSGLPLPPRPYQVDFLGNTPPGGSEAEAFQTHSTRPQATCLRNKLADILIALSEKVRPSPMARQQTLERA